MDLRTHILTENNCYKAGEKISPQGGMLHSTGANNPKLSRYVDAPELAPISPYHWNTPKPGGRSVCVHGFIGLTPDKDVATYQTLPWNHRGWGGGGKSNDTHIHIEICEGDLDDAEYFNKVYREAVEVFAHLAKQFDWNPDTDIITHSEGHKQGIASNHADVMHWFPKHGKDMDDFRRDVRAEMDGEVRFEQPITTPDTPAVAPAPAPERDSTRGYTVDQLARQVIDGEWGSGAERERRLGNRYSAVQARVNELLDPKPAPARKSIDQLAQEVIDGKHGSGNARKKSLGSQYDAVQKRVNELVAPKPAAKSIDQLAQEVIDGKHGSGDARRKALGNQYVAVQARVNELVAPKSRPAAKSVNELADEVMRGVHGSGRDRMRSLGSQYSAVQKEVNRRMR